MNKLFNFHGGLKLPTHKFDSGHIPLTSIPIPDQLILPLQQHIGSKAKSLVSVGDYVYKGQKIAAADGEVSAPIHAPSSGTIHAIENRPVAHISGLPAKCIVIQTDGKDQWEKPAKAIDKALHEPPEKLCKIIAEAGIVGLGGATFPSHIKLYPGSQHDIHTLVINAAECEPLISCDETLIKYHADGILSGINIIQHILKAERVIIGIEDDMTEAIDALTVALKKSALTHIVIQAVPTIYPTGGEKQLIKVLTNKEVPSGGIPAQIGIVCHNVGTAYAIYEAILKNRPLISRIVTISGEGVQKPCNKLVLVGTPILHLIQSVCQCETINNPTLIIGGPMMGFNLTDGQAPVVKGTNCILVKNKPAKPNVLPCIRCGKCEEVCPANLLPQQIYWHVRSKNMKSATQYHLFDCIECGCCSYVCPSHIPLVHYYRFAKYDIAKQKQELVKSDLARERHEAKQARITKQKADLEARRNKKRAALKKSNDKAGSSDAKKAAIEAALARVNNKKAEQEKLASKPDSDQ
jgi:Na+-translocating ferredoxin:NAD+ oxidoreductase subunit C